MRFFDVHAHIASSPKAYESIEQVLERAKEAGVDKIIDPAIDITTAKNVLVLHRKHKDIILPTIGLHPELLIPGSDIYDQNFDIDVNFERLQELLKESIDEFVAIGECGLDNYWVDRNNKLSKEEKAIIREKQMLLLTRQIKLVQRSHLPIVLHSRGAEKECLRTVSSFLPAESFKVLFHSYTGDIKIAKRVLEAGYYISFNGIITYPKADDVREIFKLAWNKYKNQVLTETDAPYLPPQEKRGEVCEPSDVVAVVRKMAEIVKQDIEEVAEIVYDSALTFYNLQ